MTAGQTSMDDIRITPPLHPDEGISIGHRRHPDERIFRYPLQALPTMRVATLHFAPTPSIARFVALNSKKSRVRYDHFGKGNLRALFLSLSVFGRLSDLAL